MPHPVESQRESAAQYRALEAGALVAALALLVTAVVANLIYPSSLWFLCCSATGGLLVFMSWRASVAQSQIGLVTYGALGVLVPVLGLLSEVDRPRAVNIACCFSVFGAVMFGLIEIARRASRQSNGKD